MKKWGLLLILLLSLLPRTTFAEETADAICIEGETEGLDTDAVDAAAEEMDAEVSFSDLLAEILSGEFDFTFARRRLWNWRSESCACRADFWHSWC